MSKHGRTHGLDHFVVQMGRVAHCDDVVLLCVGEVQRRLFFCFQGVAFVVMGVYEEGGLWLAKDRMA